jgi:hypothetical protein
MKHVSKEHSFVAGLGASLRCLITASLSKELLAKFLFLKFANVFLISNTISAHFLTCFYVVLDNIPVQNRYMQNELSALVYYTY